MQSLELAELDLSVPWQKKHFLPYIFYIHTFITYILQYMCDCRLQTVLKVCAQFIIIASFYASKTERFVQSQYK